MLLRVVCALVSFTWCNAEKSTIVYSLTVWRLGKKTYFFFLFYIKTVTSTSERMHSSFRLIALTLESNNRVNISCKQKTKQ